MRRIDVPERRARLALRHHLAPISKSGNVAEVACDLVGLHASDPATVYLAALARMTSLTSRMMEGALYEERSLLKILGMRRTMFVVPPDLAAIIQAACTGAIGVQERRRVVRLLGATGIAADPEGWLADVEAATMAALEARGEATAAELTRDVPALRVQIPFGAGKKWAGSVGVSTRLLFLLAAEGRIIRGRPRGSWTSSLYRWVPMDVWVRGGLAAWPTEAARAELVRRWLATFGPGTLADLVWWTGWTRGVATKAVAAIEAIEVELEPDGRTGLLLADDLGPTAQPEPWVALLPALDPTVMGWAGREWFLGEHRRSLFDRNGNAGPTVWWDGRLVGGWAQSPDGEIVHQLLDDVGREAVNAVEAAAERLISWLGTIRIIPRFRTPLEQELSACRRCQR